MADTSLIFRLLAVDEMAAGLDSAKGKLAGLGSVMGGILGSAALFGLGDFAAASLKAADAASRISAQTSAVLASTGNAAHLTATQVQELADKYGELDGVEGSAVQNGLNFILRSQGVQQELGNGTITADKLTQTMLDLSAVMAKGGNTTDNLSAASKVLGKALADPFTAARALTQAGAGLTAGQVARLAAFKKAGDSADAYKLVLNSLASATAGAAAANTTPLQKISAKFDDLKVKVGTALMPAFNQIADALLKLTPDIVDLANKFGAFMTFVAAHGHVFIDLALGVAGFGTAMKVAGFATEAFGAEVSAGFAMATFGISALVTAFIIAYQTSQTFRTIVAEVVTYLVRAMGYFAEAMIDLMIVPLQKVLDAAAKLTGWMPKLGGVIKAAAGAFDAIDSSTMGAAHAMETYTMAISQAGAATSAFGPLKAGDVPVGGAAAYSTGLGIGGGIGSGISSGLGAAAPKVKSATQTLLDNVTKALDQFKANLFQKFEGMGSVVSNAMIGPNGGNFLAGNMLSQLNKMKGFVADIASLRKMGLNANSLNQLIAAGPDQGAEAAHELVTGGASEIGQVNSLEAQISGVGNAFASQQAKAEFSSAKAIAANKVQLSLDLTGVSNDALVQALRKAIRVKGGNVQTVLGGAA